MSDKIKVETGIGTPERVAFDLLNVVKYENPDVYVTEDQILNLYTKCLQAAKGVRPIR